jgi:hypothetical protein
MKGFLPLSFVAEYVSYTVDSIKDTLNNLESQEFAKKTVNLAFAIESALNETIGRSLTDYEGTQSTGSFTHPLFNNAFTKGKGTIKKIRIVVANPGEMKLSLVSVDTSNRSFTIKNTITKTLIAGLNELDVNLPCEKDYTIGIHGGSTGMRWKDLKTDTGEYYSNATNPFQWNKGWVCLNFDFEGSSESGYTVDEIIKALDSINTLEVGSIAVHRIQIEGQSNALGVGYVSGLQDLPYNDEPINWLGEFNRVFIYNPKTSQYEGLKIGGNNMSAWDSDYTIGNPIPEATFGPELGVALAWLKSNPSGLLFIDKNVGDGKPISYFQKGSAYYTEKEMRKFQADQWLSHRNLSVKEIGWIWVQGEGDMSAGATAYKTALTRLIQDRVSDEFIKKETRLILTQISADSGNYGSGVASAKSDYAAENPNSALVTYMSAYNADRIHLNYDGQIQLGLDSVAEIIYMDQQDKYSLDTKKNWTK